MSDNVGDSTVDKFHPKNTGVAAGILFLSALELQIHLGGNSNPPLDKQRKYFILDLERVNYFSLFCFCYAFVSASQVAGDFKRMATSTVGLLLP
jgi:hypothetical protein